MLSTACNMMKIHTLPYVSIDSYSFTAKTDRSYLQDQRFKEEVNATKKLIESIPRGSWVRAVRFTNPYETVVENHRSRKISRAYYKLREIVKDFRLEFEDVHDLHTLHLCEGPGGFIEAMVDIRNKQDKALQWTGITLKNENIKNNEIPDFVSNLDMSNITYGADGTGDLTNTENISFLGEFMQEKGMPHLITADGGFDVSSDHSSQEEQSYKLLLCQVVAALECQRLGGAFIMKVFDCYSNEMTELLYILSIHYSEVHMTKPYSSRPCNSEKYVVCKGFKGITQKERKMLKMFIENYDQITIKQQPNDLYVDTLSHINTTYSNNQLSALNMTIAYATRSNWVKKPQDMSRPFIQYYL